MSGEQRPALNLTAEDGKESLRAHVQAKAAEARARYGPNIDWATLLHMLSDREIVRYPTRVQFDAEPLQPGEFAHAQQDGARPTDGFSIYVHPAFESHTDVLPLLVAYHLVRVNYGDIVTHEEAECYGAALLGLDREAYYDTLCNLADSLPSASPE